MPMVGSPSGTVTLFSDLEGSTRLRQAHPDAMKSALSRHDTLLRSAVIQHAVDISSRSNARSASVGARSSRPMASTRWVYCAGGGATSPRFLSRSSTRLSTTRCTRFPTTNRQPRPRSDAVFVRPAQRPVPNSHARRPPTPNSTDLLMRSGLCPKWCVPHHPQRYTSSLDPLRDVSRISPRASASARPINPSWLGQAI